MGGHSSRSGSILLSGLDEYSESAVKAELAAARFRIVEPGTPGVLPQAVILSLDGPENVDLAVRRHRAQNGGAAIVGVIPAACPRAADLLIAAFRAGLSDAVTLDPRGLGDLSATLKLAIERQRIRTETDRISDAFSRELGRRARNLRQLFEDIESAYEDTLGALVRALDVREKATAGHSVRVAYFTCWLARKMGVDDRRLKDVYRGSLLHDIGKIGIPDSILLKPAKLTTDEFEVMKTHTTIGRDFLAGVTYLGSAIDIPWSHHEKWNGAGYPQGLAGEDIPFSARAFAVCDVYDALRSRRCYKEAFGLEQSLEIIRKDRGAHFDPDVVDAFLDQDTGIWERLDKESRADASSFEILLGVFREIELDSASIPIVSIGDSQA